ncbi:Mho1 protein [Martiniozyma asiatica (nom. inval.)]|nr:Mho1 protein [Martiniozyma asiatica]
MSIRPATHAGTWYSSSNKSLCNLINSTLQEHADIVPEASIIIGPHAGYAYSGRVLAAAYSHFKPKSGPIFILGPSHHVYFDSGVFTTSYDYYATPIGDIPVDVETVKELIHSSDGIVKKMKKQIDDDEHSFELHMPFLKSVLDNNKNSGVTGIVPILISGGNFEQNLSKILSNWWGKASFIISTDFCHWGLRFGYTKYSPLGDPQRLISRPTDKNIEIPIWKSIEALDKDAMRIASQSNYSSFKKYIASTGNTICGAKPLSVVIDLLEKRGNGSSIDWVGYDQSSKVLELRDSSVSYAAGIAVV